MFLCGIARVKVFYCVYYFGGNTVVARRSYDFRKSSTHISRSKIQIG